MKTRVQLYGMEASSLLRDVSMYQCMTKEQVYGLYPGKQAVIKNLLSYLSKQGRISQVGDYYCASPECAEEIDRGLIAAL